MSVARAGFATTRIDIGTIDVDNTPRCLAISFNGGLMNYSLNGGAVLQVNFGAGAAANAATAMQHNAGLGAAVQNIDFIAAKMWSTQIPDEDLEAISDGGLQGRLGDSAGSTCVYDWHAARYDEWIASQRYIRGTQGVLTWNGSPPLIII